MTTYTNPRDQFLNDADVEIQAAQRGLDRREQLNETRDDRVRRAFAQRWSTTDRAAWERDRDPATAAIFERENQQFTREIGEINEERRAIDEARAGLSRRRVNTRAIAESIAVGPPIHVPPLPFVLLEAPVDPQLTKTQKALEDAEAEIGQLDADIARLRGRHATAEISAQSAAEDVRLGIPVDVLAAGKLVRDITGALRLKEEKREGLHRQIAKLTRDVAARSQTVAAEYDAAVSAELRDVRAKAIRAVVAAMAATTLYHRVLGVAGSDSPRLGLLDADEPDAIGRRWLQSMIDRGYVSLEQLSS